MKLQTNRPSNKFHGSRLIHPIYANPPYGIFSRVAREVGVSPSFARKVALGLHTSKRVATVLICEGERISGELQKAEQKSRRLQRSRSVAA